MPLSTFQVKYQAAVQRQSMMRRSEFLCGQCGTTTFLSKGQCRQCSSVSGWHLKAKGSPPVGPPQDMTRLFQSHARRRRSASPAKAEAPLKPSPPPPPPPPAMPAATGPMDFDSVPAEGGDRPHKDMKDSELKDAMLQTETLLKQMEGMHMPTAIDGLKQRLGSLKTEKWRRRPQGMQLMIAETALKKAAQARERAAMQVQELEDQLAKANAKLHEYQTVEDEARVTLEHVRTEVNEHANSTDGHASSAAIQTKIVATSAAAITQKLDAIIGQSGAPVTKDVVQQHIQGALQEIFSKLPCHVLSAAADGEAAIAAGSAMPLPCPTQVDSTDAAELPSSYGKKMKEKERSEPYTTQSSAAKNQAAPSSPSVLAIPVS